MRFSGRVALAAISAVGLIVLADAALHVIRKSAPNRVVRLPAPLAVCVSVPILMYHSIAVHPVNTLQITPAEYEAQMRYLASEGYHTITFEDLEDWESGEPIPVKPVLVTFDDGYEDNYVFGFPVWKKYGIKATIFLISGRVDTPRHLNWREIDEMRASGLVEVGAHTETHRDLTTLSPAAQITEIAGSKEAIEARIGRRVIVFDYPAGRYNPAVVSDVAGAGYKFAVTTNPGYATRDQSLLLLDRVRVDGNEPLAAFEAALAPKMPPEQRLLVSRPVAGAPAPPPL